MSKSDVGLKLEAEISRILDDMKGVDITDDDYKTKSRRLGELYNLRKIDIEGQKVKNDKSYKDRSLKIDRTKNELEMEKQILEYKKFEHEQAKSESDKDHKQKLLDIENLKLNKLNPNTILAVGANLVGILAILNYERMDSITSKAVGFIFKGRV